MAYTEQHCKVHRYFNLMNNGLSNCLHSVPPYDPDSQFSKGALSKLEAAGIPVLTSLENVGKELAAAIGSHYTSDCNVLLEEWASEEISSTRPPTWRSLYEVMRELDLEELSQEIEEYLSCESLRVCIAKAIPN